MPHNGHNGLVVVDHTKRVAWEVKEVEVARQLSPVPELQTRVTVFYGGSMAGMSW